MIQSLSPFNNVNFCPYLKKNLVNSIIYNNFIHLQLQKELYIATFVGQAFKFCQHIFAKSSTKGRSFSMTHTPYCTSFIRLSMSFVYMCAANIMFLTSRRSKRWCHWCDCHENVCHLGEIVRIEMIKSAKTCLN